MFHNYLITALRNFSRHKLYSFINIAGLTVGLTCAIFIILFVRDELSYDKWIPGSQNLYRVGATWYLPGRDPSFYPNVPFPVTPTMQAEIPEVKAQTHMVPEDMTAQVGDRQFPVTVDAVDPNFFQMINLPLVEGNPARLLAHPESVVLSETAARKFFGTANPIGKTIVLGEARLSSTVGFSSHMLVVTGILRDLPHNTQLSIDLVIPNTSQADSYYYPGAPARDVWPSQEGWAYVRLSPHADLSAVAQKLKPMIDRHFKKPFNLDVPGSDVLSLHLTPFRDVHLAALGETEAGRWDVVYGFAAIASLIIFIASINYMNLATARAMARAREVSLRKVMGAMRSQLIAQFMGESVIMAFLALVLAFSMVEILLPAFDSLIDRPITYNVLADWPLTLALVGIAILVGVLGGIYPAFVLSGFRPAARLGTGASGAGGPPLLRTILVVLQFAISIGLGVAAVVIFAQISYGRQIDLGFDRHNLLVIDNARSLSPSARDSMAQALAADPAIAGVAQSDMVPFDGNSGVWSFTLPQGSQSFSARNMNITPNFASVYGMKLLAGRPLSRERATDVFINPDQSSSPSANILINAAAARQLGYTPADAVGKSIIVKRRGVVSHLAIVGVVADTNFDGLQSGMQPFDYYYAPNWTRAISVRIRPGRTREAIAAVDRIWHRFVPSVAIVRRFQDASFDQLFSDDEREGRIFAIFVGISIFIAGLGLFGLASLTAERRTKEIGIRKVHGARTRDILGLLLWQFSIPVLIANLIAWPVAYYYLHHWLEGYAYRISLNPLYFVGAGAAALVIAWATVIVHAAHVARANPIHALRYE